MKKWEKLGQEQDRGGILLINRSENHRWGYQKLIRVNPRIRKVFREKNIWEKKFNEEKTKPKKRYKRLRKL